MNTAALFEFVKASQVLPLAGIEYNTTAKNKMRGIDSNGKPTDFSDEEKKKIELAFWNLTRKADVQTRRDRQGIYKMPAGAAAKKKRHYAKKKANLRGIKMAGAGKA